MRSSPRLLDHLCLRRGWHGSVRDPIFLRPWRRSSPARIDRLPAGVARLVRTVAVIGPSCNRRRCGWPSPRSRRNRSVPSWSSQMAPWCSMATTFRFPDEATRVVAAAGVAVARRRVVHERAARRLEQTDAPSPALVADHWYEAGDDAGTLRWAQLAGEAAFGAGASAEASHHFERALLAAQRLHRPDVEIVGLAERLATAAHAGPASPSRSVGPASRPLQRRRHRVPPRD